MNDISPKGLLKRLGIPEDMIHMQDRKYYDHLLSVHAGLTVWWMPLRVRLGGLLHSIYGTERFTGFSLPPGNRQPVIDLVGIEAEALAYASCMIRREDFDAGAPRDRRRFESRFGEDIVLDDSAFNAFCAIHLCDWLDQVERTGEWSYRYETYHWIANYLGGAPLGTFNWIYRRRLKCSQNL